ncbi:hypothetical protein, partial [Ornithinimicrobium murale]|uniref:hypothetical protein n=1 Tax=Ornithinimicrobium murale TaxID=1050153 RepID=UPI001EDD8523
MGLIGLFWLLLDQMSRFPATADGLADVRVIAQPPTRRLSHSGYSSHSRGGHVPEDYPVARRDV